MIDLPAGLAPWAPLLGALPIELALALAPWVGRLALAVGPMSEAPGHRTGEPDGYGGLARRGSYERLITAEWAIAELFPDEFLRRATAGEQLFLELARKQPRGAIRSVAIVSAGPSQLGSPRLAHLAALVVLARRAASAGASFHWGVLEDRGHRLFDTLDEAAVQRWLEARTPFAAGADAVPAWLDALCITSGDDVWLIGGSEDTAIARRAGARTLTVEDVLEPRVRALDVSVERRGATSRVRLDLPPSDDCARLLRDPYRRGAGSPRAVAAAGSTTGVRLAPGGRRLLVELDHGVVESWPIPRSPRDGLGKPRRWTSPRGHSIVALGLAGRGSILAATLPRDDPTSLDLSFGGAPHRVLVKVPSVVLDRLAPHSKPPIGTCGLVQLRDRAAPDLIIDAGGHLLVVPDFKLWPPPGTSLDAVALDPVAPGGAPPRAIATVFHRSSLLWATPAGARRIRVVEGTSSGHRVLASLDWWPFGPIHFGFAHPPEASRWGIVAACDQGEDWTVAAAALKPTRLRAVAPVVGVCLQGGTPALLTRPHPCRLAWLVNDQRKLLPASAAPIVSVEVSPTRPHVAWVTESGEVVLYSMEHDAVLMRRSPGGSG